MAKKVSVDDVIRFVEKQMEEEDAKKSFDDLGKWTANALKSLTENGLTREEALEFLAKFLGTALRKE